MIERDDRLRQVHEYEEFETIDIIHLGWSSDIKYDVRTKSGERCVLRISDMSYFETKKKEFETIQLFNALGFEMSKAICFRKAKDESFCYMLLSYIEGESLEEALPKLDVERQYQLGIEAGLILRQIHELKVPTGFKKIIDIREKKLKQLQAYESSLHRMPDDQTVIDFIKSNIHYIGNQEPTFQHGDFHPGNLILTKEGKVGVIDFNRWDIADPYEEFYKLECFSSAISVPFSKGQIDAYFNHKVPNDFWRTLAVYAAHVAVYSIHWAEKFGDEDIQNMKKMYEMILNHYDYFKKIIPCWY